MWWNNVRYTGTAAHVVPSFPCLPHFYLPFAFIIIHGSGRPAKNGEGLGAFITWVDVRWMWMGRSRYSNMYVLNWKQVSYRSRLVVLITLTPGVRNFDRALEQMIQCVFWQLGPFPPTSTSHPWCHSCDECSQAFPVLRQLCIVVNANVRDLGTRVHVVVQEQLCHLHTYLYTVFTSENVLTG